MAENTLNKAQTNLSDKSDLVIPVIEEQVRVEKEWVDAATIVVRKTSSEEQVAVDIPLVQETYRIEHVPINKLVDVAPSIREEENVTIIPVVREVLVKRYEIVEEVHVIRERKSTTEHQELTLRKEKVEINRKTLDGQDPSI